MITKQYAEEFARHWIAAWNNHDIAAIMEHYADEIKFYSPVIKTLNVNDQGMIAGTADLRAYFLKGLAKYPDLSFELKGVYAGVNSIALHYLSVNRGPAIEVFELNAAAKVTRVLCNYINTFEV